jgi:hypothetical protein
MKEINLEEIMQKHVDPHCFLKKGCYESVIEAMKEACRQTLELAAENAMTDIVDHEEWKISNLPGYERGIMEVILPVYGVNEQSILDTINQIK